MSQYYTLEIECEGRIATKGIGYGITFKSPIEITTDSIAVTNAWRSEVTEEVSRLADNIFTSNARDTSYNVIYDMIERINQKYDFQICDVAGIPAIQVDSTDGRRLEFSTLTRTHSESKYDTSEHCCNTIVTDGAGGFSKPERRHFKFVTEDAKALSDKSSSSSFQQRQNSKRDNQSKSTTR
jgi:hypothetical protein